MSAYGLQRLESQGAAVRILHFGRMSDPRSGSFIGMDFYRYISIIGIITLCAIVFAGEQVSDSPFGQEWGATPTHIRAAYDQLIAGEFSADGARELLTLVTSIFLHGGVEHI